MDDIPEPSDVWVLREAWMKQASEHALLYGRDPRYGNSHMCWCESSETLVKVGVAVITNVTFFGCLVCGRSHLCSNDRNKSETCPLVDTMDGTVICPISSKVVHMNTAIHIHSYDEYATVMSQVNVARNEQSQPPQTEAKELVLDHFKRLRTHAAEERASANFSTDRRQGLYERLAQETTEANQAYRVYKEAEDNKRRHLTVSPLPKKRMTHGKDSKAWDKFGDGDTFITQTTTDDHYQLSDVGKELDSIGMNMGRPVSIPTTDFLMDDICWKHYLRPMDTFFQDNADAITQCFIAPTRFAQQPQTSVAPQPVFKKPPARPIKPRTTHNSIVNKRKSYEERQDEREELAIRYLWPLDMGQPFDNYENGHLVQMRQYTERFIGHYRNIQRTQHPNITSAFPMKAAYYVFICDRFLWLCHRYVIKNYQGSPLWPTSRRVPELMYTFLTQLFTSNYEQRDPIIQSRQYIWVKDEWLAACSRVNLFKPADVPVSLSGPIEPNKPTQLADLLISKLSELPFSVFQVAQFMQPPLYLSTTDTR